jgi:putative heme-binding domain-containing protein
MATTIRLPLFLVLMLLFASLIASTLGEAPYGIPARVPWVTSTLSGTPDPPPPFRSARVFPRLKFERPVDLALAPGSERLFVLEQFGKAYSFPGRGRADKADLFLDLKRDARGLDQIPDCKGASESLAITFHPGFARNRFFFVMYTLAHTLEGKNLPNGCRVSRFRATQDDPPRAIPESEQVLVEWLGGGHCGCTLKFGRDGYLYISTGDGSSPNPPDALHTGQDVSDLLSSILRIDVDHPEAGRAYSVPRDNPFVDLRGARPEVWAYGLRNPWRMTFDRETGDLWVGDVGWEKWELIFRVVRGGNYGWSIVEGPQSVNPGQSPGPSPVTPPLHSIPHPEGQSITGGFVYRGRAFPELRGRYVYGDWETRRVWANSWDGKALGERKTLAVTDERIVGWAEDPDGELLYLDYEGGGIHRLEKNEASAAAARFPRTLSQTGLFADTAAHRPAPGVVPYEINAPLWADGATAERFLAVPGDARIEGGLDEWKWPANSVLAKTLSIGGRRAETQVLHFDGSRWNAYAYLWNDLGTDGRLVEPTGTTTSLSVGGRGLRWVVQSRTACLTCHNRWPGHALTMDPLQLKRRVRYPAATDDQIRTLRHLGLFPSLEAPPPRHPLVDPYDRGQDLEERARSYLHVNCSHCHRFGAGGAALINFLRYVPSWQARGGAEFINVRPKLGTFDLESPYVVCGGDPARSVLLYRISKLGRGRMPHLGSEVVDRAGVALLSRWIKGLPAPADPRPAGRTLDLGLSSTTGAMDLLGSLGRLDAPARSDVIRRGLAHPNPLLRDLFEPFAPPGTARKRLGSNPDPQEILAKKGNAEKGQKLIFESGLQCRACHRFGSGDEKLGPDLGKIGAKYDRPKLLESILDPSKEIDPKFVSYLLQTQDGAVYSGILVEKTPERVVLRDAEKAIPLDARSVQRMVPQQKSIMPDFLLQDLSAEEAADLLEFLSSLR